MKPLLAGTLRRRLQLETKPAAEDAERDEHGQEVVAWTPAGVSWGNVEPLSGRELTNALQIRNDITHRITTRYRSGRSDPSRIRWTMAGRVFNVVSIRNLDERGVTQDFLCTEVVTTT